MIRWFGTAALILFAFSSQAQLRYGFKTGLNFARMDGPSEVNTAGENLENWKSITGFHIGLSLGYKVNDYFGVRGELLYTKRGAKYTFEGDSYRIFRYDGGSTQATGRSRYLINITNAYVDLPIVAYGRWKDFELSAGGYVGLLIQSTGDGSLSFTGGRTVPLQNSISDLEFNLNHNYRKDDPLGGETDQTVVVKVDAKTLELPKTLGAYYDYPEDKGRLYNSLDYGLVAGLTYYLSRSLYAGVRLQYGLADITKSEADLSKGRTDNGNLLFRDDKDRNVVIQASVGFSF
ncbi:MAG: PorT family protein [Saprospiraceae bacterium]|nr:PorT family protein [Saprospiraceae bacterium]